MENKINIACFKEGSRTAEVKDIWQWDYGQILRIQGLNLPTAVEIHFSLDEHGGEAARRIGLTKDGVTDVPIPDLMVENESAYGDSYYFFAYIYLTDETSGSTEYKIRVKVSTRSKPEGYVSGGNDTFAEILKTVNEIAEDKVDIPVPAKVGQVLAVKKTDESGKPTEFEAKDMSGGVSDEKIAEAVGTYMEAHPIEETDPTVSEWAKQPEKPSYTALEVGADATGTAESKVSEHNVALDAHNDIRLLVQGLTERLNALADSDDTTLDQMSEVVAYIKSNKSLIDAITTSKVNVSDIIDNLTTNMSNKPLSAAQGVALKALIDAIAVPTKLSELENDSGYAKTTDIPDKLPNPQKLTFAGAVTAEYDGSGAVTVTIPEGSGGKSAYQYAVEGGYTGTEAEFASKLAQEKFANPNALTFTGAVSATYDGSEPLTVEIPSGGGGSTGNDITITELASGTIPSGTEKGFTHTGITFGKLNDYKRIAIVIANGTSSSGSDWAITNNEDNTSWKMIALTSQRGYIELRKVVSHIWDVLFKQQYNTPNGFSSGPHAPYLTNNSGFVTGAFVFNFASTQNNEICIYNKSTTTADVNWTIQGMNF